VNFLDFLLVIIVGYSVLSGFMAGFARVGIGFVATLFGVLFGFWFYRMPGAFLQEYLQSETASNLLGFFIVFSVFVIAGGILAKILSSAFKWVGLSWLDRLLGAGAGFVRGAFLAVAIVTVITAFAPNRPPDFIVNSKIMPYASAAGSVFAAMAPRQLKDSYRQSLAKLHSVWDNVKFPDKPGKLKGEAY
jgi:membrane protein required for colicin V production